MFPDTVPGPEEILEARERIRPYIHHTPLLSSSGLNEISGARIYFKCENFQKAGAFKSRGACNALFSLSPDELRRGVCTHSSGNHAQALARAAMLRNTGAHIVMPSNAPSVKVAAVRAYSGEITFCAPTLAAREETLKGVMEQMGAIEVHPYNNYTIIAGQATASVEAFNETGETDIVMAPVGGGGLLSGTALAARYFSPRTKVVAAEPAGADDAFRSFRAGKLIPSIHPVTIADGLLTSLGSKTFPIIKENVHDILTVSEENILRAMRLIWERMKIVVEPSAAVPFAAILQYPEPFAGKTIILILSGGNLDLDALPWINANEK
jgi:threonine dehydratase